MSYTIFWTKPKTQRGKTKSYQSIPILSSFNSIRIFSWKQDTQNKTTFSRLPLALREPPAQLCYRRPADVLCDTWEPSLGDAAHITFVLCFFHLASWNTSCVILNHEVETTCDRAMGQKTCFLTL